MKPKLKHRRPSQAKLLSQIRTGDDPILKLKCIDCPLDIREKLALRLRSVLVATKTGVGLAAPQVGIAVRAIATRHILKGMGSVAVMFNPEIISRSDTTNKGIEGCLSYPNTFREIERADSVEVTWQDESNESHKGVFLGIEARIVQHECDHLEGVCAVINEKSERSENLIQN